MRRGSYLRRRSDQITAGLSGHLPFHVAGLATSAYTCFAGRASRVRVSFPAPRPIKSMVPAVLPRLTRPQEANAHSEPGFQAALEAFLPTRHVIDCSPRTISGYAGAIKRCPDVGLRDLRDATSLGSGSGRSNPSGFHPRLGALCLEAALQQARVSQALRTRHECIGGAAPP